MKNEGVNNSLFREYQATNELIYHLQRLQVQLTSFLLSGIFLFVGLSLTSAIKQLFIALFPLVIFISFIASFIWAIWYIHVQDIVDVALVQKCKLEKKLGFSLERLIQERISKKPKILFGMRVPSRLAGKSPIWLSLVLTIALIVAYVVARVFI